MKRIIDKLTENGGDVEAFKKAAAPAVKKVISWSMHTAYIMCTVLR